MFLTLGIDSIQTVLHWAEGSRDISYLRGASSLQEFH